MDVVRKNSLLFCVLTATPGRSSCGDLMSLGRPISFRRLKGFSYGPLLRAHAFYAPLFAISCIVDVSRGPD